MITSHLSLEPELLGFWVKCVREASNWSQEAVAASSGLDVRTIQRVEAGNSISLGSRRSLARGLGYDDVDIFQSPKFIEGVHTFLGTIRKAKEDEHYKQFPDSIRIKALRVSNMRDFEAILLANAYWFDSDCALSAEAKYAAASMFDYLKDLGDIFDELSYSDKLTYLDELQRMLSELETCNAIAFFAKRTSSFTNENWINKTPLRLDIAYLVVVPSERDIKELIVSKRASFGFSRC